MSAIVALHKNIARAGSPSGERWLVEIVYPRCPPSQRHLAELIEDRGRWSVYGTPRKLEAKVPGRSPLRTAHRRTKIRKPEEKELAHLGDRRRKPDGRRAAPHHHRRDRETGSRVVVV